MEIGSKLGIVAGGCGTATAMRTAGAAKALKSSIATIQKRMTCDIREVDAVSVESIQAGYKTISLSAKLTPGYSLEGVTADVKRVLESLGFGDVEVRVTAEAPKQQRAAS